MAVEARFQLFSPKGARVAGRILPHIRQYEDHTQLAGRASGGRGTAASLDAIIVPASRPAANLDHAITLARAARSWLVVLCSHQASTAEVEFLLAARCFRQAAVVEVPDDYRLPLSLRSSELARSLAQHVCVNPNGDLSTKRNIGLLLARMAGWRRIFFMDDDIRDVSSDDLAAAVSLLGRFRSVGMRVTDFPDNSVVCHAHRETGAAQDVFVTGSVLAVSPQEPVGFFPEIYNEDWLFFYGDAQSRDLGWSGRNATQLHYDPFRHTRRAAGQEFGDVLAEGLYALLHLGAGSAYATREYWESFLAVRESFLLGIVDRAHLASPRIQEPLHAAVSAALHSLSLVQPAMLERYISAWREDLQTWTDALDGLPTTVPVDTALHKLGLAPASDWTTIPFPAVAREAPARYIPAGPVRLPQLATADRARAQDISGLGRGRHRRSRIPLPTASRGGPVAGQGVPAPAIEAVSASGVPLDAGYSPAAAGPGVNGPLAPAPPAGAGPLLGPMGG